MEHAGKKPIELAPSSGGFVSRRHVVQGGMVLGVVTALGSTATSAGAESAATADDMTFMALAIAEAEKGDLPFGAVIVSDGEVLATGRNLGKTHKDPTAHGEMVAIRNFVGKYPPEKLKGTTLYTSGEPCVMCIGAIIWSGIGRVVYAASIAQLATKLDQIMITSQTVADAASFSQLKITGGVMAAEAMALFDRPN